MVNNAKIFYAVWVMVGVLLVRNGGTRALAPRSLGETMPKPIDARPICGGPRRGNSSNTSSKNVDLPLPFYKQAIYGLQLGSDHQYGKLNNKIIELINAVDVALDSGGKTVVVVSRWALQWMLQFIPDDDESWEQLARDLPIVRQSPDLNLEPIEVRTKHLISRGPLELQEQESWDVVQARRVKILHYLFSSLEGEPCHFLNKVERFLLHNFNQTKYVAVHVRNMEGKCTRFNKNRFAHEQCEMSPSYIKSIMETAGVKLPIVLLTDMQDEEKIHKIQNELDQVVVPQWDWNAAPSMTADLVVGASSELFIGQQGSSGSRNIGVIREAFGKDLSTNYVFVNKTEAGKWTSYIPHHVYRWRIGEANQ